MRRNYRDMACSLYDGGWRSTDRSDLISEYELTEAEADGICAELTDIEREHGVRYVLRDRDGYGNAEPDPVDRDEAERLMRAWNEEGDFSEVWEAVEEETK